MSYEVHWREAAWMAVERFMKDDPAGLSRVFRSVDLLATEARPPGSIAYGSPDIRRVHVAPYRLIYEIEDARVTITFMHPGRATL